MMNCISLKYKNKFDKKSFSHLIELCQKLKEKKRRRRKECRKCRKCKSEEEIKKKNEINLWTPVKWTKNKMCMGY